MKKKILISITTVVLTVSMLCISVFALPQNFEDVVSLGHVYIYGLTAGTDYNQTITQTSQYEEAKAYAVEQGVPTYDRFLNFFNLYVPYDDASSAQLGSVTTPFYSGYYIHAKLSFKLYSDFSDFQYVYLKAQTNQEVGMWNWSKMDTAGVCVVGDRMKDVDGNYYHPVECTISYKNEGETIDDYSVRFLLCARGTETKPLYASVYTYTPYVYEYYYGDGSEPSAPIYQDPSAIMKENFDTYTNYEESILEDTEEGFQDFGNSVDSIQDNLDPFLTSFLAIRYAMEYCLLKWGWLNSALHFVLALGLVAFVLNITGVFVRSVRNRKE